MFVEKVVLCFVVEVSNEASAAPYVIEFTGDQSKPLIWVSATTLSYRKGLAIMAMKTRGL